MALEYLSGGWPLSSWISPGAAFFLFVNVLIGAIVVTSRGHRQGGRAAAASTRRLCRSASSMVLDRLRSFSIFSSVHPVPMEELDECYRTSVAEPATSTAPVAAGAAAPADGAPSSEFAKEEEEEAEVGSKDYSISSDEAHGPASQGLAQQQSLPAEAVNAAAAAAGATAAVEREKEKAAEQEEATMQRAPACRRETEEEAMEGKEALNARAESFIRKFREDLKLERLNSIINYTRTLRRGAAAAPPPTAP